MIEIINNERHLSFAVIGAIKKITIRAKLKGTSFDGRQDVLRNIYNEHLLARNVITYKFNILSRTMEVIAVRDGAERSVGFVPEEITRVLWNNDDKNPIIQGIEIRKHIDHNNAPEFGAVARLLTNIPSDRYMEIMKEFEASVLVGPTKYNYHQEDDNVTGETDRNAKDRGSITEPQETPIGGAGSTAGG